MRTNGERLPDHYGPHEHQAGAGSVPWRRPWHAESGLQRNLTSGREYRGVNVFLLGCQAYSSPYWVHRKPASWAASVREGEKATPVIFWKWLEARKSISKPTPWDWGVPPESHQETAEARLR